MTDVQPGDLYPDLAVRPARASDRAAIEAIAVQVWDGHDYLPQRFTAWLAEAEGLFCVATVRDRVVGTAKLSRLSPAFWWMEGLRVDPAFRRQGVAQTLQRYLVRHAHTHCAPGTLAFSTASDNVAVQHLAQETGFALAASFAPFGAATAPLPTPGLKPLAADAAGQAWAFLSGSAYFAAAQRTLEESWRFYPITPKLLRSRC
ncbi:MAG: GNAT family N-acetyltransferase, partial [Anaerolineae bacterium]|nr:GNAT family N-acetyltransferase [Anaerolineae bacterium]